MYGTCHHSRLKLALKIIALLVAASVFVVGGRALWQTLFFESPTAWLQDNWRMPRYMPDFLDLYGISPADEKEVRSGRQVAHYTFEWLVKRTDWDTRPRHVGMMLSLVATELEMDLGGERKRVDVDGVQGWLSHLSTEHFIPPSERLHLIKEYWYDRAVYLKLLGKRGPTGIETLDGPIITLQWNRDGIHYLLVGQDRERVTVDEMLKIANSFARAEFPYPWKSG